MPLIKIEGDIPSDLLAFIKTQYKYVSVEYDEDDEYEEVTETEWFKNIQKDMTPQKTLKLLRNRDNLSQAELAAKRITPEEINRLENITDNYELAVKHNDTEQMIFCDEQFHKEIVEITGNNTLVKFSTMAQELALRFRYIYYDDFSRYENMPSEHRGIIAALKSGDSTEARRVVSEHIKALRAFVIEGGKTGFRDKREF